MEVANQIATINANPVFPPAFTSPWVLALRYVTERLKKFVMRKYPRQPTKPKPTEAPRPNPYWPLGYIKAMSNDSCIIKKDDNVTVVKALYPKGQYHFLVMPNDNVTGLSTLKAEDIGLLRHMQEVGEMVAVRSNRGKSFFFGYHARPVMQRLHLHVISQDLSGKWMKSKKAWNSFATKYFLNSTGKGLFAYYIMLQATQMSWCNGPVMFHLTIIS